MHLSEMYGFLTIQIKFSIEGVVNVKFIRYIRGVEAQFHSVLTF